MMDFVDAATTNVLSPDILPVEDMRNMLWHIESWATLNDTPNISSEKTFTFTNISGLMYW